MFNKSQLIEILKSPDIKELVSEANEVRKKFCGEEVYIRGLIEFSNVCRQNCKYCGLRKDNKVLSRYRMSPEEIFDAISKIWDEGIETVILQSGDDLYYSKDMICSLIVSIKKNFPDMALTLSIGERPLDDYKAFFDSGADRYLLKHETSNNILYGILHPNQSFQHRIEIIQYLRKLGFQVGVGNIVGLPYQTVDDLAQDILFFQDFQPDMIGIGPFLSQSDTPLASESSPEIDLVLKCIALSRIATKNALIPSTTSLHSLDPKGGHILGLGAGANVIMINFTESQYRTSYVIYDKRCILTIGDARRIIKQADRIISFKRGDSFKKDTGHMSKS